MKKIMFNDAFCLTHAVLDGTKTMTRRVVPQSLLDKYDAWYEDFIYKPRGEEKYLSADEYVLKRTHYKVGEVVAIAQSYNDIGKSLYDDFCNEVAGNTNKMFVKADLMKHHIRITDVKVERLHDISENECLKEGIKLSNNGRFYFHQMVAYKLSINKYFDTPREAFASLIDKISGKGTWESNPWVVAYSFELVD